MAKKIVIVDNSTWNIYNFRLSLIRRLKSEGYRIVVIAPVDEYIHYLNESHFTKHIPLRSLAPQSSNAARDLLLTWELFRIYRKEKPDLILHYTIKPNIYGSIAAWMAGIPSISTITGLGYTFLNKSLVNKLVPSLYRLAFRGVKNVVFYNRDDRDLFIREKLLAAEKTTIIPGSGVNTNHFRPLPIPESNKFVFLFIGRLLYDKGLEEFVEAARMVRQIGRQAECWVIGELNTKNPSAVSKALMLKWIEEMHIRYFGVAEDVRKFIKMANVVVLPSYREGVPRSILEAMAMGKPIITTDTAGCRETVITGENGLLIAVKDSMALAEAMVLLYQSSSEELLEMGAKSRERALSTFDEKIVTEQFSQLITHLLGKKKTGKSKASLRAQLNRSIKN